MSTPEGLKELYRFDEYWHKRQTAVGLGTIEERAQSDYRDGRIDYWVALVGRYAPPAGTLIEIGCGHGGLLRELRKLGFECIGVEVDPKSAAYARMRTGVDVREGMFPGVALPAADVFISIDVLEHSTDPAAFVCGAANALKPGGVVLLQTAIERGEYLVPFAPRFREAFDDIEHTTIFTERSIRQLAARAGLEIVSLSERIWLMGEIVVLRKPVLVNESAGISRQDSTRHS
jgi:2-polyprenyl-3-methyl-5-hydroxy-6-metoxy-1,4-benzoquinol methylase